MALLSVKKSDRCKCRWEKQANLFDVATTIFSHVASRWSLRLRSHQIRRETTKSLCFPVIVNDTQLVIDAAADDFYST